MPHVAKNHPLFNSVRTTGWLVADRFLRLPLAILVGVTLARSLGPEGFGRYSYALALVAMLQGFVGLGLQGVLVRYIATFPDDARALVATALRLRIVAGVGAWVLIALPAWLGGASAEEAGLVGILGATLVAQAGGVFELWFQAQRRAERAVQASIIPYAIEAIALIIAALFTADLYLIALIRVAGALSTSFALWFTYRQADGPFPVMGYYKDRAVLLLKQAWPVALSGLLIPIYKRSDQIMLRHLTNAAELGQYSLATSLAEAGAFLPTMIVVPLFPLLIAAKERSASEYESVLARMLSVLLIVSVALAAGIAVGSWLLIPFIYGSDYAPARPIVAVYVWGQIFVGVRLGISRWLIVEERLRESLYTHLAGALANIVLNLVFIPFWGGVGAAFATVLSYAVASYAGFWCFVGTRSVPAYWHQAVRRIPAVSLECFTLIRSMSQPYRARAYGVVRALRTVLRKDSQ